MNQTALDSLPAETQAKLGACREAIRSCGSAVVAFSAGVDSTFLLALAVEVLASNNVLAAMGISPSLAQRERQAGRELAGRVGAQFLEIETCELSDPAYAANPANRCFHCKAELFRRLNDLAAERGMRAVLAGANADDAGDFRPGLDAGRELGVLNPLMDAGLTKQDIRLASRAMGLATWDKPAMACLASRVPYGEAITAEKLARIERAEYLLKDLGFGQCRVRDHGTIARIEVPPGDVSRAAELRRRIAPALRELGYSYVTLDLEGFRSGSMNEVLGRPPSRPE